MFLTSTNDAVTTLTLNRPPVNAISEEWVRAFDAKLDELGRGPRFTVLHIRSEQKVFCAGADLKEVRTRMDATDGPDRMYAYVASIQRLYARIEKLPQVTLAEIGGAAIRFDHHYASGLAPVSAGENVEANPARLQQRAQSNHERRLAGAAYRQVPYAHHGPRQPPHGQNAVIV